MLKKFLPLFLALMYFGFAGLAFSQAPPDLSEVLKRQNPVTENELKIFCDNFDRIDAAMSDDDKSWEDVNAEFKKIGLSWERIIFIYHRGYEIIYTPEVLDGLDMPAKTEAEKQLLEKYKDCIDKLAKVD